MLRRLHVSDLAIIDRLNLNFEPGLNVLTGETGAGKSILLAALDVALGGRPDADVVRTGAEEAIVEAVFAGVAASVRETLAAAGIPAPESGEEVIIRRIVAAGGRTRAFVNGAQATLALLRDLAPQLLRVYGQDEHQALRRVESHRELLDAAGGLGSALDEMRRRHARLGAARDALTGARTLREAARERAELLEFQANELLRANLVAGEDEALAAERVRLAHAERLATLVSGAEQGLYSSEGAVVELLGRALATVRDAERLDGALATVRGLLESTLAELEEAGSALGKYLQGVAPDPERLEAIEERLAELARLKRKYGGTLEDLVRRRDELAAELAAVGGGDETLDALQADVDAAERDALAWAKRLSVERRRVARDLERGLVGELRALGLEGARFQVQFGETEGRPVGPAGWDEIEFLLSANTGEELRSLANVASGGELSRIMLALKTLTAADDKGASLIFDEVDAGIGGAVAEVVGKKLRQLGKKRQVLCVTHLPVIAAYADHHIGVSKRVEDGRTLSTARPLSNTERVAELARMLGGARETREAREHAEELLRHGHVRAARGAA
jgi:DNA repair protein RecN (Recombination protein N)